MTWRWWQRRQRRTGRHWAPPGRIPDGDIVLGPGQRRWADLLQQASEHPGTTAPATSRYTQDQAWWLNEPTQVLPTYQPPLTRGQLWRGAGGGGV